MSGVYRFTFQYSYDGKAFTGQSGARSRSFAAAAALTVSVGDVAATTEHIFSVASSGEAVDQLADLFISATTCVVSAFVGDVLDIIGSLGNFIRSAASLFEKETKWYYFADTKELQVVATLEAGTSYPVLATLSAAARATAKYMSQAEGELWINSGQLQMVKVELLQGFGPSNQPPEASFSYSPGAPRVGQAVWFDATASLDPDGRIVQYTWNFGDGSTSTGRVVAHTYAQAGTYIVRLTVRDDDGATDTATDTVTVSAGPGPGPTPPQGMPSLDKPGIYVWGDPQNHWHITVVGDPAWSTPHPFLVMLESRAGTFANIAVTPSGPTPSAGRTVTWRGSVQAGRADLQFDHIGDTLMQLTLYLDIDGDGDPTPRGMAEAKGMVFIRACKTHPPRNPFVISAPRGATQVLPSQNFRIGYISGGGFPYGTFIMWDIEYREAQAGCGK